LKFVDHSKLNKLKDKQKQKRHKIAKTKPLFSKVRFLFA